VATGEPAAFRQTPRERRLLLLGCCLSLGITSVDVTIVNIALPTLSRSLHADLTDLQWVIDGYMLVLAALLVLAGSLGDRLGRRASLRLGLVLFAAASLACSLAPSATWLIVFRVLQGIAAALLVPNALSTLTNVITDSAERARALGVWSAVFGIAAAAGPILGGVLVQGPGWRSIFWVNLPLCALTFALITRYAPETKSAHPRELDLPGQALILLAVGALIGALIEAPSLGWTSGATLGLFGAALVTLGGFIAVERRANEPLIELRFFSSAPFSGAASIAVLAFAIFSGFLLLSTLYLQEVRGASPLAAGVELLPAMGVMTVVAPLVGRVIARSGSRGLLTWSGVLLAAGSAALALAGASSPYGLLVLAYALVGFGSAFVNPPITHAAVSGMPTSQAGVASAIASSTRQLGNALGVAILGSLLTSVLSARLTTLGHASGLPATTRRVLLDAARHAATLHTAAIGGRARGLLDGAFVAASHPAWWLAAGMGGLIALIGFTTSAPGARRAAIVTQV
jgi:EmrB/QacA subfamily drug resistance transporter